jgi:hypothetical protein
MASREVIRLTSGPGLAFPASMRNLGLALALSVMMLAPHAVEAKKHVAPHKRGRAHRPAPLKLKRASTKSLPARESDELASAVAQKRAQPKPVMTAAAPAPTPAAAPVEANAPLNMSNQVLDDEVPGSRKR